MMALAHQNDSAYRFVNVGNYVGNTLPVQTEWPEINKEYGARCLKAFTELLSPLSKGTNDVASDDAIMWDYSKVIPRDRSKNGIQLFDYARQFDPIYSAMVRAEEKMVHECAVGFGHQFSQHKLPFISYGPGSPDAVLKKDLVLMHALNSSTCDLLDMEEAIVTKAAGIVNLEMGNIKVRSHTVNFVKEYPEIIEQPSFGAMLGGTMGQFDMHEFFKQFYKTTGGQGILFFTLNGNRQNPENLYLGPDFKEFKLNPWYLLKSVARDLGFRAQYAAYSPECDPETRSVHHRYRFKETAILITSTEDRIIIPRGSSVTTGQSKRPDRTIVDSESKGTGMILAGFCQEPVTQMCGYMMVGDKFPHNYG